MSFILDALKKVDQQKKFGGQAAAGEIARSNSAKRKRSREIALIGAIAAVSAAVTAGGIVLYSMSAAPVHEEERIPPQGAVADPDPVPDPERAPAPAPAPQALPPRTSSPVPAPRASVPPVVVEAVANDPPADEPLALQETEVAAPTPAVRIVGRSDRVEPDPASDAPPDESFTQAPSAQELVSSGAVLPELVLQGTSILDGRPVAVISDQRVFEGDFVQGARVIRIDERVVELELDGRRFTLTL